MAVRVAVNGFGRIGRLVMRAIIESRRNDVQIVGVNDLGPVETNAHLLKYDSIHGRLDVDVKVDGDIMDVGQGPVKVTAERDPGKPKARICLGPPRRQPPSSPSAAAKSPLTETANRSMLPPTEIAPARVPWGTPPAQHGWCPRQRFAGDARADGSQFAAF